MNETKIDLSKYHSSLNRKYQVTRLLWNVVWRILDHPLSRNIGNKWKRCLLRLFGTKIHPTITIYSSAKVYFPANLEMNAYSHLAPDVDCYNISLIKIGKYNNITESLFMYDKP